MLDALTDRAGRLWSLTTSPARPPRRTPHVVVARGPHRTLRRYADPAAARPGTSPLLFVPPIAAPASSYDLSPEFSLVAHLAGQGRTPYVVDFGEIRYGDRRLGFDDFALDIIPTAISQVLADSGADSVDLLGWSLGGTLSFLTAAGCLPQRRPNTRTTPEDGPPAHPIRSITAFATPLDYDGYPGMSLAGSMLRPFGGEPVSTSLRLSGGVPAPLVRLGYRTTSWKRELTKPWFIATHLDDAEALERMRVVDHFQRTFPGYPGRLVDQIWQRFVLRRELAEGRVHIGGRRYDLRAVDVPVQLFGSHHDTLCPWRAAHHGVELFRASPRVEFTTVDASHLGLLAGPAGVEQTWPVLDAFLTSLDAPAPATAGPR